MFCADNTDVLLAIRVTTRAAKDAVTGEREGRLILCVRAAPTDGEANVAVVKVLAKTFGVPKSSVTIERGARGGVPNLEQEILGAVVVASWDAY